MLCLNYYSALHLQWPHMAVLMLKGSYVHTPSLSSIMCRFFTSVMNQSDQTIYSTVTHNKNNLEKSIRAHMCSDMFFQHTELTCLWMSHRVLSTSTLNRCQGTPVWAGAHREVCFCLALVSSPLRLLGRGTETGPAVWPSSLAARPQTHPAPDQALNRRTTPPIWWGFLVVFGTSCIPT